MLKIKQKIQQKLTFHEENASYSHIKTHNSQINWENLKGIYKYFKWF